MRFRVVIDGKQAGARFERIMSRAGAAARKSLRDAAVETGEAIVDEGRSNISGAGNFGPRWTEAFRYEIGEGGGNIRLNILMGGPPPVSYWRVFQEGRVIKGQPMLWVPLSFASDAKGKNARDFGQPLFRVDRPGKAPLLMAGKPAQAKYFGKESVTIPKKFQLVEIARRHANNVGKRYSQAFRRNRRG